MSITNQAGSMNPDTAGVRLCGSCGRPVAARNRTEYTAARARLLLDRGFCLCRESSAHAQSPAQATSRAF